mgnify:CR=1 FL=1
MVNFEGDIAKKKEQLQWRGKIYRAVIDALWIIGIERDKIHFMDRLRPLIDRIATEYPASANANMNFDEESMNWRKMPLAGVQGIILTKVKSGLEALGVELAPEIDGELAMVINDIVAREKELREREAAF